MPTIGDRIRARREELGMSQDELGKRLGYKSRSSINKIELDQRNLTQSKIKAIADALDTTPSYIMGWDEPAESVPGAVPYIPNKRIPVLGRISAGLPLYAEQNIESYMSIELPDDGEYFALIAHGDSMDALGIKDGYTLIVRRQNAVDDGDVAVVLVDGEDATVKRFYQSGNCVTLMPQSTNPKHLPQIYDTEKIDICVQGKVAKVLFNL